MESISPQGQNVTQNKIKTVFLIDKSLIKLPAHLFKDLTMNTWDSAVEAAIEYSRIVWDIFPDELIKFIVSGLTSDRIGSWTKEEQNVAWIKSCFARMSAQKLIVSDEAITQGIRAALESLAVSSIDELKELQSAEDKSKVFNRGRVICFTSISGDDSIELLEKFVENTITDINKRSISLFSQLKIDHSDFLLINIFPDPPSLSSLMEHPCFDRSPLLSCELISVCANQHLLVNCLKRLALKHFNLASTTLTGISFKSKDNDIDTVEVIHHLTAHACLLKHKFERTPYKFVMDKGYGFKTVTLRRSPSPIVSVSSSVRWRISPFVSNKNFQNLTTYLLSSGRPLFFKVLGNGTDFDTKLFELAPFNGQVYLQQCFNPKAFKSSLPSNLSDTVSKNYSQTNAQLSAGGSKQKNVQSAELKKISTPGTCKDQELERKRRKIEIVRTPQHQTKKDDLRAGSQGQAPPQTAKSTSPSFWQVSIFETGLINGDPRLQVNPINEIPNYPAPKVKPDPLAAKKRSHSLDNTCMSDVPRGPVKKNLTVAEVCSSFGLTDVDVEDFIVGQTNDYKVYFTYVLPFLREANENVSYPTLARLLGAKWREFSTRQLSQSHAPVLGNRIAVLPGIATKGDNLSSKDPGCQIDTTNQEKAGIERLTQEVTNLRCIVESLVTKSIIGSSNAASDDVVPVPDNSSKDVGSAVASQCESHPCDANAEAIKEQLITTKSVPATPMPTLDQIKLETDDDIEFVCLVYSLN